MPNINHSKHFDPKNPKNLPMSSNTPTANNNSLEAILSSVGVNCSKCMMSRIRMLRTPAQREGYFRALKMSEEQIRLAEKEISGK